MRHDPEGLSSKIAIKSKETGIVAAVASAKSHQTVINHLKKIGFKKKLDVWVPHDLTQKNISVRMDACESLLNRNKTVVVEKR